MRTLLSLLWARSTRCYRRAAIYRAAQGPYKVSPNVPARNTAICSRVTGLVGQYFPPPQPLTTPRRTSSSIHLQKGLEAGTSANISAPATQFGGLIVLSSVRSTKTAIASRVADVPTQYAPPPQPLTTPRRTSSSTHLQKGLDAGTSANISEPATQFGGLSVLSSVRSTKTAITSRAAAVLAQYEPPPQPLTTPRRASSSTHLQNGLEAGMSLKTSAPATQFGGLKPAGSRATSTKTAIWARVVDADGQYVSGPQPPVTFLWRIVSTNL